MVRRVYIENVGIPGFSDLMSKTSVCSTVDEAMEVITAAENGETIELESGGAGDSSYIAYLVPAIQGKDGNWYCLPDMKKWVFERSGEEIIARNTMTGKEVFLSPDRFGWGLLIEAL